MDGRYYKGKYKFNISINITDVDSEFLYIESMFRFGNGSWFSTGLNGWYYGNQSYYYVVPLWYPYNTIQWRILASDGTDTTLVEDVYTVITPL